MRTWIKYEEIAKSSSSTEPSFFFESRTLPFTWNVCFCRTIFVYPALLWSVFHCRFRVLSSFDFISDSLTFTAVGCIKRRTQKSRRGEIIEEALIMILIDCNEWAAVFDLIQIHTKTTNSYNSLRNKTFRILENLYD